METNPAGERSERYQAMRRTKWVWPVGLWLGFAGCSDTMHNLGRVEASGGVSGLFAAGGSPGSAAGGGIPVGGQQGTGGIATGGAGAGGIAGGGPCPPGLPASSSACSPDGQSCYYSGCSGTASYCSAMASCTNGSWYIGYTNCMCPSSGGASSSGAGGSGGSTASGGSAGAGGNGCSRVPVDDANCTTTGYPPYAYFCQVPATRPDPTCVNYNAINSGDYYCCP
jgi:hypothetical protein